MTDEQFEKAAVEHAEKAVGCINAAITEFGNTNPECPAIAMAGALMTQAFRIHASLFPAEKDQYLFSILDLATRIYDTVNGVSDGSEASE